MWAHCVGSFVHDSALRGGKRYARLGFELKQVAVSTMLLCNAPASMSRCCVTRPTQHEELTANSVLSASFSSYTICVIMTFLARQDHFLCATCNATKPREAFAPRQRKKKVRTCIACAGTAAQRGGKTRSSTSTAQPRNSCNASEPRDALDVEPREKHAL